MIPNEAPYGNSRQSQGLDRLIVPIIVVLVGFAAFGIGRLSVASTSSPSIVVHQEAEASTTAVSTIK